MNMLLWIVAAALAAGGQVAAQDESPALVVLGDSLSDVGNAAAVADYLVGEEPYPEPTVGLCNPVDVFLLDRSCEDVIYARSRVSNGPVAVEYLAQNLGLSELVASYHTLPDRPVAGTNYAVAGATARGERLGDLSRQVDMLLLDYELQLPQAAAYVVMIGGNDAIDALQAEALPELSDETTDPLGAEGEPTEPAPETPEAAEQIITAAVTAIEDAVVRLIEAGAECIVVANVPDLGALPAVRASADEEGVPVEAATTIAESVASMFNEALAVRLDETQAAYPGRVIAPFDLHTALDLALDEAAAAGLNTTDACFDSESYVDSMTGERSFHPDCAPGAAGEPPGFARFVFWDGIHPTGVTHAALGESLIETYRQSCPVQLAAAAPER